MDLQHIDVGSQTLDAGIYRIEDMLARQSHAVYKLAIISCRGSDGRELTLVVNAEETLGQDHDAVTRDVVLLQGFSNYFFGSTMRIDIRLL